MMGSRRRAVLGLVAVLAMSTATGTALGGGLPIAPPTTPVSLHPATAVGTLTAGHPVLRFNDALHNNSPLPLVNNPDPIICAISCSEFVFTDNAPGVPVLVGLKSTVAGPHGTFDADDGYDLYVYGPTGKLASDANGIGSNGQAALVSTPVQGRYTVVVTFTYIEDADSGYRGQVRLMHGSAWHPPAATCDFTVAATTGCFELPRLRALPAYDLITTGIPPIPSTPLGFPLPVSLPTPTSCYVDETIGLDNTRITNLTNPILRCLRFTTDIQNVGAGPLNAEIPLLATDAKGQLKSGYVPGDCQARQLVVMTSGKSVSRPAGDCEFHVEHAHFHYSALLQYALYKAGRHSAPVGPPIKSSKASFCLTDDDYFGFGSARLNGPRVNVGQPDCNVPKTIALPSVGKANTGTFVSEGMTPGWGDVYTWDTPGQFINVTHVPGGVYDLVEQTNPDGRILVAGPKRTCSLTKLRLTRGPITDRVKPLATKQSITCPNGV